MCVCSKCEAQDPLQPERDGERSECWDFSCCRWEPPAAEAHGRLVRSLFLSLRLFDKPGLSEKQAVTVYAKSSTVFSLFMHQVPFFRLLPFVILFSCLCSFPPHCFSHPAHSFSLAFFTVSFFFTSLTGVSVRLTFRSLFICALSRPRSLSFQPPVTQAHAQCSNLLPITLKCTQSRWHANTHLVQSVRTHTCWASGKEEEKQTTPLLHHCFLKSELPLFFFPQF